MREVIIGTSCKGRLEHLKLTLPNNLAATTYPYVRFQIVDWGGDNALAGFLFTQFPYELLFGKLMYIRVEKEQGFDYSRANNVSLAIAKKYIRHMDTAIYATVDADNYTGDGFVEWLVNEAFDDKHKVYRGRSQTFGRLCTKLELAVTANGYDESMKGGGVQDADLQNRIAEMTNTYLHVIPKQFRKCIEHDNSLRDSNYSIKLKESTIANRAKFRKNIANKDYTLAKARHGINYSTSINGVLVPLTTPLSELNEFTLLASTPFKQ